MKERMQFRQGDVLITSIKSIPKAAKVRSHDGGRVVLAYGEVTGHSHSIAEAECELLEETADDRFLRVLGREIPAIRCRNAAGEPCWIPMGEDVSAYKDLIAEGPEVVRGVVLRHEEHNPFVIPAGDHRIGGPGVRTQREYSPEAIRPVVD
jgi:hypothetical protein